MKRTSTKKPALNVNIALPSDAIFRIFKDMIDDLEVCGLDYDLHAAIRSRDVVRLLDRVSRYNARSIIERLGSSPADVSTFGKLYQVGALIKKYPFKGLDTFTPALQKFLQMEERCRLYNTQNYRALIKLSKSHPKFYGLLNDLREEIYDLIGAAPDLDGVYVNGMHGPGQTAGSCFKNGEVTEFFKLSTLPYSVTSQARTHAISCISADPRWMGALDDWYRRTNDIPLWKPINVDSFWNAVLVVVDASDITSVPKTALTDRFIAMEATMNVFLQLGVDRVLRGLLRDKWGYDLNSQVLNQQLAEEGSRTNKYATLDLVGASDTISLMLCYLLFPPEWISLLLDLRMKKGIVKKNGDEITFNKLSSMGNGYTFAVESLIFGACVRVAMRRSKVKGKSAVYGDDLVCPRAVAPFLVEILDLCGFEVNSEKSFTDGPFRESCGKDFFLGHNVRPLFITDVVTKVPDLFHILNSFTILEREWSWPYGHTFERTRRRLLSWIPPDFRAGCRGPICETTDTHIFTEEPMKLDKKGYRYHLTLQVRPLPYRMSRNQEADSFLFRKLMAKLRPNEMEWREFLFSPVFVFHKWDWRRKFDRGNAFDIMRRDHVRYTIVRSYAADSPLTPTS